VQTCALPIFFDRLRPDSRKGWRRPDLLDRAEYNRDSRDREGQAAANHSENQAASGRKIDESYPGGKPFHRHRTISLAGPFPFELGSPAGEDILENLGIEIHFRKVLVSANPQRFGIINLV